MTRALAVLTALAALTLALPAAGRPVTLKADTASEGQIVTLGDIFEDAGPAAAIPVANRTGSSVVIDAALVQSAARRAGLDWTNAEGLRKIVVHGGPAGVGGPAGAPVTQARAAAVSHANVEVLSWSRNLQTGEIVQPTDLTWVKVAAAPADSPTDTDALIGQSARRPLRAGAVVLARDVAAAQVIKAGDVVTVTYEADGISLTMQGKALAAAGVGDALSVQNPTSKKIVQALVPGPGQAVVGPAAEQMRAVNRSTRIAAR